MKITIEGKYRKIVAEPDMALTAWDKGEPLTDFWMDTVVFIPVGEDYSDISEMPYKEALLLKELSVK